MILRIVTIPQKVNIHSVHKRLQITQKVLYTTIIDPSYYTADGTYTAD
jgi:hypothetical protein